MNFIKSTVLLVSIATIVHAKTITITGKALNYPNGKVYIVAYDGLDLKLIDSTVVKKEVFVFKNKNIPRGLYKFGPSPNEAADVILGEENLQINFDKTKFYESLKIDQSAENEGLSVYNKANIDFSNKLKNVENKAQSIYQYKDSEPNKFAIEINKLQKEVDSLSSVLFNEYKKAGKNTNLFISKYSKALMQTDTTPRLKVFKNEELLDEELCRSNLFAVKTQMYFQRYTKPEIPDYQNSANELIQNLPTGSNGKIQVYKSMLSLFANANLDYYATVLRSFKEEYKTNVSVQNYLKKLPKKDMTEGDEVPELAFADTTGKILKLSSLKGKVVLIDFWASWCGPCRMENPNVVRVYKKYKDMGFTVLGVSLDQSKDKWMGAIKSDGLTWNHISDLKGWSSEAAKLYGVRSIPQTYLIDREGKIIAKNLRGEMLENKLQEIFKQ